MTLAQKAAFVVLATHNPLQNRNKGIASLCIPPLSLTDGPSGLGDGLRGVTQFPSAIAVAATFNPAIARAVGSAIGAEARTKGITGVQGTELNLARVPLGGRIFETYGEDPFLASLLGVANISGIQSRGVIDVAKHFSAYTQETARVRLNQIVSPRALAELYNAPFRAAVQRAHVASLMCSYGKLNGVNTCSDPSIYAKLKGWGFTGFVRSDLESVPNIALAFRAGISLIKPASAATVERLVKSKVLPITDLNRAVLSVLRQMFRFGLIARPPRESLFTSVTSPAHAAVALRAAEASVVLLKNAGSILPLSKKATSIAVIGVSAAANPVVSGGGSSAVIAPYVVTPLSAIRASFRSNVRVVYQPGAPSSLDIGGLNGVQILSGTPLNLETSVSSGGETGKGDLSDVASPGVTPALATAVRPGWSHGWARWSISVRARESGTYEVAFQQIGDSWLYLNGLEILASTGLHGRSNMATTVRLVGGHSYTFSATWFVVRNHPAPRLGIHDVTARIRDAVAAARKAQVAIVFADDFNTEGTDRSNLFLPGDANALIAAVASVNPHTIVVLNTGGAVYMPWLSHVAGVLEAWYPGQEDGTAIARILTGTVSPSGRLPITFPASTTQMPVTTTSDFPGINSRVTFGSGLDVGYRWYQANRVAPLFPFGFGLGYSTFKLSNPTLTKSMGRVSVRVLVTNTSRRTGTDVVQVYVHYPDAAGEPPEQLRSLGRVVLGPLTSKRITLTVPRSGFQVFQGNSFTTLSGEYRLDIGQSSADLPLHVSFSLP